MSDAMQHFAILDELVQVIYQDLSKFVLLSRADDDRWTVLLGLTGDVSDGGGRWWRGKWEEADVLGITGANASEVVLEAFAERIGDSIVQGEISVGNWQDGEENKDINLTIGPTAKRPLQVALVELSSQEASAAAAKEFFNIALQAQSRKCRLNPPAFGIGVTSPPPQAPPPRIASSLTTTKTTTTTAKRPAASSSGTASGSTMTAAEKQAQEKIRALEARLADPEKAKVAATAGARAASSSRAFNPKTMPFDQKPKTDVSGATKAPKGASLANPNKKARKYQAVEFGSDDEDDGADAAPPPAKKKGASSSGASLETPAAPATSASKTAKKARKVQKVVFGSDDE